MNIRLATMTDVAAIRQLVLPLLPYCLVDSAGQTPGWVEQSLSENFLLQAIESAEFDVFVGDVNHQVVAYMAIQNKTHVFHLFVAQDYQRQGLATQLWNYVKAYCRSDTYSVTSSDYAVPLYEKLGFIKTSLSGYREGVPIQPMVLQKQDKK